MPQRIEAPALAVSVSVPPYDEFGPPVNARLLHDSHLTTGAIFGLRPDRRDASFEALSDQVIQLRRRHPAVPLVLCIPDGLDARSARLIQRSAQLRVRGLVVGNEPVAEALRRTLTMPMDLAADVTEWLALRLPRLPPEVAELCRTIFRNGPAVPQLETLLARVGESSRTARARLRKLALPSPAHWHQAARALHSALCLQRSTSTPLFQLAMELGYSDHSALCHQLLRLFGMRASQVRRLLGWEWLLDAWLTQRASVALATA